MAVYGRELGSGKGFGLVAARGKSKQQLEKEVGQALQSQTREGQTLTAQHLKEQLGVQKARSQATASLRQAKQARQKRFQRLNRNMFNSAFQQRLRSGMERFMGVLGLEMGADYKTKGIGSIGRTGRGYYEVEAPNRAEFSRLTGNKDVMDWLRGHGVGVQRGIAPSRGMLEQASGPARPGGVGGGFMSGEGSKRYFARFGNLGGELLGTRIYQPGVGWTTKKPMLGAAGDWRLRQALRGQQSLL